MEATAIEKCGFYLPDHARYDYLLKLPEEQDIAKVIKKAMEAIEEYKSNWLKKPKRRVNATPPIDRSRS